MRRLVGRKPGDPRAPELARGDLAPPARRFELRQLDPRGVAAVAVRVIVDDGAEAREGRIPVTSSQRDAAELEPRVVAQGAAGVTLHEFRETALGAGRIAGQRRDRRGVGLALRRGRRDREPFASRCAREQGDEEGDQREVQPAHTAHSKRSRSLSRKLFLTGSHFHSAFLGELFQQLALPLAEPGRHLDEEVQMLVAACGRTQRGQALPAQADHLSALRSFRDPLLQLALEGRHLDLRAERGLRERDRHLAVEVLAVAREQGVGLHRDHHVEIARRAAGDSRLSLAREAQPRAVVDAGRHAHLDALQALDAPRAAAVRTALAHDLAGSGAIVAGTADSEEALLQHHLSAAPAARADFGAGAGTRPASATGLAGAHLRDLDLRLEAREHVVELDFQVVAEVGTALTASLTPSARATSEEISEEVVEDVSEAAEVAEVGEAAGAAANALEAEAIVGPPLLRIGEHRVGLAGFLEALLGLGIFGIAVRVMLERELAISLLELALVRTTGDAQDFVVIALGQVGCPGPAR